MNALLSQNYKKWLGLLVGLLLLLLMMYASVRFGVVDTSWQTILDAYQHPTGSTEQLVIRDVRVPRALIAVAVGGSLGLAGALMQALTRNPLADPGIFGVNAGASLGIVIAVSVFGVTTLSHFTWIALLGAAVSGAVVYLLGSLGRDGLTPLKLTLAGSALTAMFASFTHGLLLIHDRALEEVLFWLAGSVAGRKLEMLIPVLPYLGAGWVIALLLARPLYTLMMGDDVAKGLGQRTVAVKLFAGLAIVLLAGGAVAVAGPIGFVGLVIPHIARWLVGLNMRWMMVWCGLLGALLLLGADLAARWIAMPKELPIGIMTAVIGVPFFVLAARKGLTRG